MSKVSATILLDSRTGRINKEGKYPVSLRIIYNRTKKLYSLKIYHSLEDFEKIFSPKARNEYKEAKLYLQSIEQKANQIIKELPLFSFTAFEKRFLNKLDNKNVFDAYQNYIKQLKEEGRAGTASNYECSVNSLKGFKSKINFEDVSPEFLKSYEKWMLNNGLSLTTVGIYLRCLRTLFNEAIENGIVKTEHYPFGKRKYQIPASRNIKKALSLNDIKKIFDYQSLMPNEQRAKDYWIFSYLCNGMNIKDLARLKYKNIQDSKISFIRAKTERTSRQNQKHITAILTTEAKEIIKKWGTKPEYPENYIFPILNEGITPEKELAKVRQAVKTINKYIKQIAKKLSIEKNISTYTARHSFSTVLKRSGVSVEFISESLGHSDLKTTENYLDSFEDSTKIEYANRLTDFTNNSKNNGQYEKAKV